MTDLSYDVNISSFRLISFGIWHLKFSAKIDVANEGFPCPEVGSELLPKKNYKSQLSQINVIFVLYL